LVDGEVLTLPEGQAWEALWVDARDERAVALLGAGMYHGLVIGDAEQRAVVSRAHEDLMRACVSLERVALGVLDELDAVGVGSRLLKGPAVAHLDFPGPEWRGFGDVDLLVRADDYDTAVDTLLRNGRHRRSDEVRPGFDRRFGKGVCLIRPDGIQIDLHRTLAAGPFGLTVEPDLLFQGSDTFALADRPVTALDREGRFLHACFHAALGDHPPRLTSLRDVARLAGSSRTDVTHARALARRWRAEVVLASAVATAWTTFRLPHTAEVEWAFTYVPSRYERTALAAYVGPGRTYARQMAAALPAIHGLRSKLTYASSLLFADGAYVAGRDGGYLRRLRRAASAGLAPGVPR
jgi:hypothetical protein